MLLVKDLHAYYGRAHILHGVTLQASAGEVVALLGRNGAGKSTVMKTIMGLVPAAAGQVTYWMMMPPSTGPRPEATPETPPQTPMAAPRLSAGNTVAMMLRVDGIIAAPPMPWITRKAMSR